MLRFEHDVVAALTETPDPQRRAAVAAWVDAALHDMPELLRAGVLAESVALASWASVRRGAFRATVASLGRSPIGVLRQYVRLFRSLVIFAELELAGAPAPP